LPNPHPLPRHRATLPIDPNITQTTIRARLSPKHFGVLAGKTARSQNNFGVLAGNTSLFPRNISVLAGKTIIPDPQTRRLPTIHHLIPHAPRHLVTPPQLSRAAQFAPTSRHAILQISSQSPAPPRGNP